VTSIAIVTKPPLLPIIYILRLCNDSSLLCRRRGLAFGAEINLQVQEHSASFVSNDIAELKEKEWDMKEYKCVYQKTPDWSKVPAITLDVANWRPVTDISVEVQVAWNEEKIMYHGVAHEPEIRAVHVGQGCDVCEDSCLEFFYMPEGYETYINFECNPNEATWIGIGTNMPDRIRLWPQDEKGLFNIRTDRTEDGWELFAEFPISFTQMFYPGYEYKEGNVLRANCMKCGDLTKAEHYLSWNPFDPEVLSFHNSEYFGKMTLVK